MRYIDADLIPYVESEDGVLDDYAYRYDINEIPTVNVAPRAEVARELGELIKDEIYMTLRAYCNMDAICLIDERIDEAVKKYESEGKMRKQYTHYENVTKEILDNIKVGDLVRVNNWKRPMRVKAVSENYFVMTQKVGGETCYSVCEKLPWGGVMHNCMRGGMFHCGTDGWLFGCPLSVDYPNLYEFENEDANKKYLQKFEDGKYELSTRSGIAIYELYVKHESEGADK